MILQRAVELLLEGVKQLQPTIWHASLSEIGDWWRERSKFNPLIKQETNQVTLAATGPRSTLLFLEQHQPLNGDANCGVRTSSQIKQAELVLHQSFLPCIGVTGRAEKSTALLRDLGYWVKECTCAQNCALFVDSNLSEQELIALIKESRATLVRINRWPSDYQSCFCISGDIDCFTLLDFARRCRDKTILLKLLSSNQHG